MVWVMDELEELRSRYVQIAAELSKIKKPESIATLEDIEAERNASQRENDLSRVGQVLKDQINEREQALKQEEYEKKAEVAKREIAKAQKQLEPICEKLRELAQKQRELLKKALSISKSQESNMSLAYPSPRHLPRMINASPEYSVGGLIPSAIAMQQQGNEPYKFNLRQEKLLNDNN